MRVKFKKGFQRKFLQEVLVSIGCPSLRELMKRGFDVSYSALKNYSTERRNLPLEFFENLLEVSGIDNKNFDFEIVDENYGRVIGGRKSRK